MGGVKRGYEAEEILVLIRHFIIILIQFISQL